MSRAPVSSTLACLALIVAACSSGETNQQGNAASSDFCSEAVLLLQDETIGDSPSALLAQITELEELAPALSEGERDSLLLLTAPLMDDLDSAVAGNAPNGWSSDDVVSWVSEHCDSDDLVGWTVQP